LIIESSERKLSEEENKTVQEHLDTCPACAAFQKSVEDIQDTVKNLPFPSLSSDLEVRTREICHAEIRSREAFIRARSIRIQRPSIPVLVWGALFVITVLTIAFVVPQIKDLRLDQSMTFANIVGLTLVLQNAVMLILTPLIMRRFYPRRQAMNPV
jgi:anti-sigma factor RsiW